jgi:hypothetical protein
MAKSAPSIRRNISFSRRMRPAESASTSGYIKVSLPDEMQVVVVSILH